MSSNSNESAAEKQFVTQMEQIGFVILDVPFFADNHLRNKAAKDLGVIQEKLHFIIEKDVYENTPELYIYGQDKRLYVNTNFETFRQIQNELNESRKTNVLQFDSIANMYFLAGHTIEDDPNILDYVESSPNVHGVGTLEEMQEEREAYKKKPEPQQAKPMPTMQPFQKFKNDFPTQSYLKFCELEMENIKPQDPFVRSFKKTAKSLGVNTLWDGKMKVWKLDVPQDAKEFAILLKRYGSNTQEKKYYEKLDATQQVLFYSRLSSIDSKTYSKIFEPNSKLYSKISKMLESKAIAMQQKQQHQHSNFLEKQESQKKGRGR